MGLESPQVIFYMICICIIFMLFILFWRQVKIILKMILQGTIGLVCVYLLNVMAAPIGLSVGINLISAVVIGVLGVPGLASLYIVQFIL